MSQTLRKDFSRPPHVIAGGDSQQIKLETKAEQGSSDEFEDDDNQSPTPPSIPSYDEKDKSGVRRKRHTGGLSIDRLEKLVGNLEN